MKVDDSKLQRWHPKFKLDNLPDIVPSALPQPPEVQKITTVSEALETAKLGLNSRV